MKNKIQRLLAIGLAIVLSSTCFVGCGNAKESNTGKHEDATVDSEKDNSKDDKSSENKDNELTTLGDQDSSNKTEDSEKGNNVSDEAFSQFEEDLLLGIEWGMTQEEFLEERNTIINKTLWGYNVKDVSYNPVDATVRYQINIESTDNGYDDANFFINKFTDAIGYEPKFTENGEYDVYGWKSDIITFSITISEFRNGKEGYYMQFYINNHVYSH